MWRFAKPDISFEESKQAPTPDYADPASWAALPSKEGPADFRPVGVDADAVVASIDVFFIHATGYVQSDTWNSLMDPNSTTAENTRWMMANTASVFSDARVFAPRYRQATIFSFLDTEGNGEKALEFAYQDVVRAFDYYMENHNEGRPFVIAGHSQGSRHTQHLIREKIDNTSLSERMIAAYAIGIGSITNAAIDALQTITVCDSPAQTNCLIHYATFAEGAPEDERWMNLVCVNPLTWKRDGGKAEAKLHKGYVPTTGDYNPKVWNDKPSGQVFKPLKAPEPEHTWSECRNGRLFIAEQDNIVELGPGNYHAVDYQMFHMNIRENLVARTKAYFSDQATVSEK